MKSLTFYLVIWVAWGVMGCQKQRLTENSKLEVYIPESVHQSFWFRERLKNEELFLSITVHTPAKVMWHQTFNGDVLQAVEIPAWVFEEEGEVAESPFRIEIAIWEGQKESSLTPLLSGGRELQKEDLSEPISIYLSVQNPILADRVDGF